MGLTMRSTIPIRINNDRHKKLVQLSEAHHMTISKIADLAIARSIYSTDFDKDIQSLKNLEAAMIEKVINESKPSITPPTSSTPSIPISVVMETDSIDLDSFIKQVVDTSIKPLKPVIEQDLDINDLLGGD